MASDTVLRKVEDLLPLIRSRRDDIEKGRRMPGDLVDRMRDTGIFSLPVPRAIGGEEASPADLMRAIEMVATADGSAGWCAMIAASANMAAGYMNEQGAREVVADVTTPRAGIAAPSGGAVKTDGGVRVSGKWSFASGITHCDWVWAGCLIMENGKPRMTPHGPEIVHAWMPVHDVKVLDTWHVSGLSGTGSNDFTATDVFVPQQRLFALLDPTNHRKEPLYQMPPIPMFVAQLASVSLGIARSALDELTDLAQKKVPSMYMAPLADKAVAQVELAKAEAALHAARSFLYETVEEQWRVVSMGRPPDRRLKALARLAAINATDTGAAVTKMANTIAGGSSIYLSSSLQRHARDAEAITHHFTVAQHVWEEGGRVLMGREPLAAAF
jgi:alkylation response protein AidB-like acyl-CoA dehydrogenase